MAFRWFKRQRAVGLDVGEGAVRALALERRRDDPVVAGVGWMPVEAGADVRRLGQAVQQALAAASAHGEPVVAAVGGPDVVVRQVLLPPVPPTRILPALEIQHRDLGLLPPGESVLDAQILRRARDGISNEVLSVSAPRARVEERARLFEQAAVAVEVLDVEALALLNGAIGLTGLEPGELLVLLTIGERRSALCLYSEQGPVVARYLDGGAGTLLDALGAGLGLSPDAARELARQTGPADAARAEAACRPVIERMAEDVRLSLTFYRTEYDRDSLPRYAVAGHVEPAPVARWVAERLGLGAPMELMDPLRALRVTAPPLGRDVDAAGPQFLGAFGLALRGL
jgi:type IV pilus assembly protein PilM